ncbi:hypothetical protein [Stenotrophomonas sp.]|uniref:hypothetical protein n=1 Tax=Stenotrophomonas sp. TaxID=69392 RepID=UPI0028AC5044|nr:hypothetical protein [Stenotrophomonas sp.]
MDVKKLRAFVIGPIGDRDAEVGSEAKGAYEDAIEVFEYIISPACDAVDVEPFRADHISRTGEINEQIFRQLRDAPIVIADLTGANPNVMYELGLRHTTGKLTVQIGEKERLPFDISSIRTILFKRTEAGLISAKRSLIAALADGLEHGSDPVTATGVWLDISGKNGDFPVVEEDEDSDSSEPLGFLEQLVEMEAGLTDMSQTMSRGSSIMREISEVMNKGTQRIGSLPMTANYSARKLEVANQVAQELKAPAVRLNVMAQDFKVHVDRIEPGLRYLLQQAGNDAENREEIAEFLDVLEDLVSMGEESAVGSRGFSQALERGGEATRMMRRVNADISSSALSIADTSSRIAGWKELLAQNRAS